MSPRDRGTVLPYHFVPLSEGERRGDVEVEDFREQRPRHLGHHHYAEGCHSGRLVCRLTTVTPTFVGAARREDPESEVPAEVTPFEIDDRPAIPGSSLRGMISSMAETIAGSALRVLDHRMYSYRSDIETQSLSAIGMVFKEQAESGAQRYELLPITVPVHWDRAQHTKTWRGWFDEPRVRVLIEPSKPKDRPLETYRQDRQTFYGLRLANGGKLPDDRKYLHGNRSLILAQKPIDDPPTPPVPWEELSEVQRRGAYTRGIVRVMQDEERQRDLPESREHELFLPFPEEEIDRQPKFPISPLAVERFHALADERTAAHRPEKGPPLPYEPIGTLRNESDGSDDRCFRLKTGDLVYFEPTDDGKAVGKIALSAVWRERVEKEGQPVTSTDFVASVDPELVPFHEGRTKVTIAEQLFGFVAQEATKRDSTVESPPHRRRTDMLASRLRFADARLDKEFEARGCYLPETTLRILDSPKPPSPAMYFAADGRYRAKSALAQGRTLPAPSGRKFYVHQSWDSESGDDPPWQTADTTTGERQKVRVRPLRDQVVFTFHIDYDNLTDEELGLLVAALEPCGATGQDETDEPEFLHKLGMGKSLGLGSVRVEVLGCFEVDRRSRYGKEGLFRPRYGRSFVGPSAKAEQWPDQYRMERQAVEHEDGDLAILHQLSASWRETAPMALRRLGQERFTPGQVVWPRVETSDGETESYQWFVSNDNPKESRGRKALQPIGPSGWPRLPVLPVPKKK